MRHTVLHTASCVELRTSDDIPAAEERSKLNNPPGFRSGEFGGQFDQKILRQKIEDVDHLKQVLNRCWSMLS